MRKIALALVTVMPLLLFNHSNAGEFDPNEITTCVYPNDPKQSDDNSDEVEIIEIDESTTIYIGDAAAVDQCIAEARGEAEVQTEMSIEEITDIMNEISSESSKSWWQAVWDGIKDGWSGN